MNKIFREALIVILYISTIIFGCFLTITFKGTDIMKFFFGIPTIILVIYGMYKSIFTNHDNNAKGEKHE